jgi:hypothetical protein
MRTDLRLQLACAMSKIPQSHFFRSSGAVTVEPDDSQHRCFAQYFLDCVAKEFRT